MLGGDGRIVTELGVEPRLSVTIADEEDEAEAPQPQRARVEEPPTFETFADVLAYCNKQLGFPCTWSEKNEEGPENHSRPHAA